MKTKKMFVFISAVTTIGVNLSAGVYYSQQGCESGFPGFSRQLEPRA